MFNPPEKIICVYRKTPSVQRQEELCKKFNISRPLVSLLANRGITSDDDINKILSSRLEDMNDYHLLNDITKACEKIRDVALSEKHIRIIGDYDIDGVCSTYILYKGISDYITKMSGDAVISYDIPDRILDGYGLNKNLIDKAKSARVDLIITCDNGISAIEQIKYARSLGIEVIVTDHHEVSSFPEGAYAVIDPKRLDSTYPFRDICGGLVAYKVIQALFDQDNIRYEEKLEKGKTVKKDVVALNFLEFAALATVGDIMPLVDENHIVAKLGLIKMKYTENLGLRELIKVQSLEGKDLSVYHLGFVIGPCINAAGRLASAKDAMKLLLSSNIEQAHELALSLKQKNDERKGICSKAEADAVNYVKENLTEDTKVIILYMENVHESLCGIIAGRVKETFYRPTIVLTNAHTEDGTEIIKGSGRSIPEYDMFSHLLKVQDLFVAFGGHKLAAGMSLKKENLEKFKEEMQNSAVMEFQKGEIDIEGSEVPEVLKEKIYMDAVVPVGKMSLEFAQDIKKLEPYGQSFPQPNFYAKGNNYIIKGVYGDNGKIVQLLISDESSISPCKGVYFNGTDPLGDKKTIDIIYQPEINEFGGTRSLNLKLKTIL